MHLDQQGSHMVESSMLWVFSGIVTIIVIIIFSTGSGAMLKTTLLQWLQFLQGKEGRGEEDYKEDEEEYKEDEESVHLAAPPSKLTYPDMLLFHNVHEDVSENSLKTYLNSLTGSNVVQLFFADDDGVLVYFDSDQDLDSMKKKCQDTANALNGQQLSVLEVHKCEAILVENLNPASRKEALQELFFDNKRNLGIYNCIQRVEVFVKHQKPIVFFRTHEDVDDMLAMVKTKSLQLDNYSLKIYPYFECLGLSGGTNYKLPSPIDMTAGDLEWEKNLKIRFLRECPAFFQEFKTWLLVHHAMPSFEGESLQVTCLLTPDVPGAHKIFCTWSPQAHQAIRECLHGIKIHPLTIPAEDWSRMIGAVLDFKYEHAIIIPQTEQQHLGLFQPGPDMTLFIVGKEPYSSELFENVKEKMYIVEKKSVSPHELRLLELYSFHTKQAKVQVTMKERVVTFQGTVVNVNESVSHMLKLLQDVQKEKLPQFSYTRLTTLHRPEVTALVLHKFKHKELVAFWKVDELDVYVLAFSMADIKKASRIIKKVVVECSIPFVKQFVPLLQSEKWKILKEKLEKQNVGLLSIYPDTAGKKIVLIGTNNVIPEPKRQIEEFLQKKTIYTKIVFFQPNQQKFLVSMWMQKLNQICRSLDKEKVKICPTESGEEFELQGTQTGLEELEKRLSKLGKKIVVEMKTLTSPVMVKYLHHEDGVNGMEMVGKRNSCLITFQGDLAYKGLQTKVLTNESLDQRDTCDMEVFRTNAEMYHQNFFSPKHISTARKAVEFPSRFKGKLGLMIVTLVSGKIAEQMADVIVNTTQPDLNLKHGAVSSSILEMAGQALQEECVRNYPEGVKESEIAVTLGHRLQCRAVFHLSLPSWSQRDSASNLKGVVTKCLAEASSKLYTSLVFPALGTGNLRYPTDETAQHMLEAIDNFQLSNTTTSLRDVKIVIYREDKEIMQAFKKALCHKVSKPGQFPPSFLNEIEGVLISKRGHF